MEFPCFPTSKMQLSNTLIRLRFTCMQTQHWVVHKEIRFHTSAGVISRVTSLDSLASWRKFCVTPLPYGPVTPTKLLIHKTWAYSSKGKIFIALTYLIENLHKKHMKAAQITPTFLPFLRKRAAATKELYDLFELIKFHCCLHFYCSNNSLE